MSDSYFTTTDGTWFRPSDFCRGRWVRQDAFHWEPSGLGVADAELFDRRGPVGRATQNLLLNPAG